MTECERLVESGVFPSDFFQEEVQCEFLITSQRKRIWAVEVAALLELDAVCKRHGLRYFLAFGGLLGAVRHQGFIPWDDDIDVLMFREDYEKLFKLGDEFTKPYFLQTPYSDPGAVFSTIRLRNSNTTWMVKEFSAEGFNHGLGIDIFPLDNWRMSGAESDEDEIRNLIWDCSTYLRRNYPNKSLETEIRVKEYIKRKGVDCSLKDWESIQRLAQRYSHDAADCVACVCVSTYPYERMKWPISFFSSSVLLPFCEFEFPVPAFYRDVLKITYGDDFMQFPPVENRGAWHHKIIFDPDRPYTEYLKG